MTDLLPITIFFAIGLVLFLIAVECAGLPRIVRRCDAGAKKKWKAAILLLKAAERGLKDAERAGEDEAVVESRRLAVTHGRLGLDRLAHCGAVGTGTRRDGSDAAAGVDRGAPRAAQ